jgi:hypoxanthine phosphoribosyltransferase
METLQVKDKKFAVSIPEAEILKQVKRVAGEINRDYDGREPLFLAVLNGAFIFAADLMKEVVLPSEIQFIKLASYEGTTSTGAVTETIGMKADISGRDVVIIEDIVDTGLTMQHLVDSLSARSPRSIAICSLLVKPANLKIDLDIRYKCFEIPNDFILGYGLDYDGFGRNTRDIYTVVETV